MPSTCSFPCDLKCSQNQPVELACPFNCTLKQDCICIPEFARDEDNECIPLMQCPSVADPLKKFSSMTSLYMRIFVRHLNAIMYPYDHSKYCHDCSAYPSTYSLVDPSRYKSVVGHSHGYLTPIFEPNPHPPEFYNDVNDPKGYYAVENV